MKRYGDEIVLIVGGSGAVLARVAEAAQLAESARASMPVVLGTIRVDMRQHISAAEAACKMMISIDREIKHPKEQQQPRSPKARFRKGRA